MLTAIAITAIAFIALAACLSHPFRRRRYSPNPYSVTAIRARLEGEKRVAEASKREAARLSAQFV